MAITAIVGRGYVKSGYVDINLADVATGVAANAFLMPENGVLLGGFLKTITAWNSTTSDVAIVGDSGVTNRYAASTTIRAAAAYVALVPTGHIYTAPTWVSFTWTSGGGTPTTGKTRLYFYYMVLGQSISSQG